MIRWEDSGAPPALPLIGTPARAAASRIEDLAGWLGAHRADVAALLARHGALLFRGFGQATPEQFAGLVRGFSEGGLLDYAGGASQRKKVADHVFTSTETAAHFSINQHHEGSYLRHIPRYIAFLCEVPAAVGGETPLADSRRVYARLDPALIARFEASGVRYLNNLANGFGIGKSWQAQFQTEDRAQVEARLVADGYEFEWKPNGGLRTSLVGPATLVHPQTGERVWVAQADHWHPSGLGDEMRSRLAKALPESEFPLNATFGDGQPIAEDDLRQIREAARAETRTFPWKAGDILLCDNHLVSHGRRPFEGARRVLVALG